MGPVLLVTYPVDLGSATLAANLEAMFSGRVDLDLCVFSPSEVPDLSLRLGTLDKAVRRTSSMPALARACAKARAEGRRVLFQATGAALFSMPFVHGLETWVALDWTRKLFEPILGSAQSNRVLTDLHGRMFRSQTGLLPFTGPVRDCLLRDYRVAPARAVKVPMPFAVEGFPAAPPNLDGSMRVLFVGGDFERKGGHEVLRWHRGRIARRGGADPSHPPAATLTLVTQGDVSALVEGVPGVTLVRNDPSMTARDLMARHDVFVLPTRRDAFPLAIGEAAAAGLCVVTSPAALGCREVVEEGVNGHVVDGFAHLCAVLDALCLDPARVESMKRASRAKMAARFSYEAAFRGFEEAMDATSSLDFSSGSARPSTSKAG